MEFKKNKIANNNDLPEIEFNFPLKGIVIKARTLEEAQGILAQRKNQNNAQGEN